MTPNNMTTTTPSAGQSCAGDIATLLRARTPLIWLVTAEEARAERVIVEAAASAGYALVRWDCSRGLTAIDGKVVNAGAADVAAGLAAVRDSQQRQVFVLRDLPTWLRDPNVLREVRNLCAELPLAPRASARAMIVVTTSAEIPPDLASDAAVVDVPLPDRAEVAQLLDAAVEALPDDMRSSAAPNGTRDAAIDAAIGLTALEAQGTFARSLIAKRRIDPPTVAREKRRVVARERVLEWFDPIPRGLDGIGGLELLKSWLVQRRGAFTPAARAYGLRAPKGVLLVGVPGCGKSMSAKAIAAAWGMPLLRLDMGALKSKWVGESEGNIRKALKLAETVAPAILWLDELEKALGGATQGAADGGVSSDALGAILQWMQDRAGSVFVVATANDVSKLPPELLRKGRFDEVFFVDAPTRGERVQILRAALADYGDAAALSDVDDIDLGAVAAAADEFTGAEIAALVPDALFAAFADGARPITTDDLIAAARATVPIARTAGERITALRQWAVGRARPASAPDTEQAPAAAGRALDL